MAASHTSKRLIRALAEAVGVGILCAVFAIAWGFVFRKNLGWEDYKFHLPTFFGAGAIIYASAEMIAGGRMVGSFLGAILGLLMFGWLVQFVVDGDHVIARLIGPGIGFFAGSVLGALVEAILRGRIGLAHPSAGGEIEERNG
jgi:hypothetical protein